MNGRWRERCDMSQDDTISQHVTCHKITGLITRMALKKQKAENLKKGGWLCRENAW